jgi:hypothetical protein
MTYLEMGQKLIRDLGLQITLGSVEDQSGMNKKIVDWIADADVFIQSIWFDWDFLWKTHSVATIAATRLITAPSDLGTWDIDAVYLDYTTDDYQQLYELDYRLWRRDYGIGTQYSDQPDQFVILPNTNLYLEPRPDKVYAFTAEYWRTPLRMTVNASVSPIPERFQRAILAKAKIYYAEHDEFATVFELATNEYTGLLKDLEAAELPGDKKKLRMSRTVGQDMATVPE